MALIPDDPLVRTATFGKQVEQFLEGDVGSYLLQRARDQVETAVVKLKDVDPTEWRQIMLLQMEIHEAEHILSWLGEAVAAGLQAMEHIKEDA